LNPQDNVDYAFNLALDLDINSPLFHFCESHRKITHFWATFHTFSFCHWPRQSMTHFA
jgi:hypothetical protein